MRVYTLFDNAEGYLNSEFLGVFSSREKAEEFRLLYTAKNGTPKHAKPHDFNYYYPIEEYDVDKEIV